MFKRPQLLWGSIASLLLVTGAFAETAPPPSGPLSQAETRLFGRHYEVESHEQRLARMETLIFGEPQTGPLEEREARLGSVVSQAVRQGSASTTPQATSDLPAQPAPPNQDATDYPAVTQLETFLLSQTYTQEDIAKRLTRLERQVFLQTFDNLAMVDRVDQLTLKVFPKDPLSLEEAGPAPRIPQNGKELAGSNVAIYAQISAMERSVFAKTFDGELLTHRLARLESQLQGGPQNRKRR